MSVKLIIEGLKKASVVQIRSLKEEYDPNTDLQRMLGIYKQYSGSFKKPLLFRKSTISLHSNTLLNIAYKNLEGLDTAYTEVTGTPSRDIKRICKGLDIEYKKELTKIYGDKGAKALWKFVPKI
jgi:hypothetical protein